MTDEYKKLLFDYLTGQLSYTSSSTDEVFIEQNVSNINLMSLLPAGTDEYYIYGITTSTDQTGETYALYGGYGAGSITKGFIAILNDDFTISTLITTFSSGTTLRPIYALEVNTEDNTFYGIDYNGSTNRFIMLNNFTIPDGNGNYQVKLRTSYNFSDNTFYPFNCRIFKNVNSAHYIFVGQFADDNQNIKAIELRVNVGMANEWNSYTNTSNNYYNNAYVDFNSDDNAYITLLSSNGSVVRQLTKNYTSTTFTTATINSTSSVLFGVNNVYFVSNSNFYYSLYNVSTKVSYLYQYNGSNTLINSETLGNMTNYQLKGYNGQLYIYYNINDGNNTSGQAYYFRYNGTWSPIQMSGFQMWSLVGDIFVGSKFNLMKIFMYTRVNTATDTCLLVEDYNPSNYNSTPYIDGTAIYPQKARLYSGGDLVFARNDYNISCLGNTFTTTIEIPNVYLNSITTAPSQLISKTNKVIVNYTENLTKNIYEKVYLNFINSISSYNYDTGDYFDTSILVKNVAGLGANYTSSFIRNWETTKNGVLVDSGLIDDFTKFGDLSGELYVSFTPTGEADKMHFLDKNENEFAWIDVSNCVVGTNYDIYQKVKISDNLMEKYNVVYNNNPVQFNGNDIVYYGNK